MDAISLGIMWDRLISITDEIVSTLVRTSFSTIAWMLAFRSEPDRILPNTAKPILGWL